MRPPQLRRAIARCRSGLPNSRAALGRRRDNQRACNESNQDAEPNTGVRFSFQLGTLSFEAWEIEHSSCPVDSAQGLPLLIDLWSRFRNTVVNRTNHRGSTANDDERDGRENAGEPYPQGLPSNRRGALHVQPSARLFPWQAPRMAE